MRLPRLPVSLAYRLQLQLLLLPYLLGAVILAGIPALSAFGFAFVRYDGLSTPIWRGWRNFQFIFADIRLWRALENSLIFVLLAVPPRVLGALALALLLHPPRRGAVLYRTAVCLPTVIPDAAYALLWLWLLNPLYGPINVCLRALGLPAPAWLIHPFWAKPAIALMWCFQIGEGFAALLAGRQSIPAECYAAAAVDGAGRWQMFRHITLPLLMPWLVLLTLRDIIQSFQATFTPAYLMTGGGPYYATLFLPLLAYDEAFEGFRFGQGAAIMLLTFLFTLVIALAALALFRGWGYADET